MLKKRYFLPLLFFILLFSSCDTIDDVYQGLIDYGYHSPKPMGPKRIPIDKNLLGSYSAPMIITKKNAYTYNINFLATSINKNDVKTEAHITRVKDTTFLNVKIPGGYAFIKIDSISSSSITFGMINNQSKMGEHIKNSIQNSTKGSVSVGSANISYYSMTYQRTNRKGAFETQRDKILSKCNTIQNLEIYMNRFKKYPAHVAEAKEKLVTIKDSTSFKSANLENSVTSLEAYLKEYPTGKYRDSAQAKISHIKDSTAYVTAETVHTIESYEKYLTKYAAGKWSQEAIDNIHGIKDQTAFKNAKKSNTIDALQNYKKSFPSGAWIEECDKILYVLEDSVSYHKALSSKKINDLLSYKKRYPRGEWIDSCQKELMKIATEITPKQLRERWKSGDEEETIDRLLFMINSGYVTSDKEMYYNILIENALHSKNDPIKKRVIYSIDTLPSFGNPNLTKGFINWSMEEFLLAEKAFTRALNSTPSQKKKVKKKLKKEYKRLTKAGHTFPKQKEAWKKYKKL